MRTAFVLQVLVLCLPICLFSNFLFFFSFFPLLLIVHSLARSFAHLCVRSFVRFVVRSIVRWSDRSSVLPFDRTFVRSLVRWCDHLLAPVTGRSSVPSFVLWFCCSISPPSLLSCNFCSISSFFLFSFSLSFFPWYDRPSVHLIVPFYVFSSDRSFIGPIVRLPFR